jgi:hypothetical protein
MNNDLTCPHCGTPMEILPDIPGPVLHAATFQGSPIHRIMREEAYKRNYERAEAGHQARMAPYWRRIDAMRREEALQAARRQGLLAPRPRIQF